MALTLTLLSAGQVSTGCQKVDAAGSKSFPELMGTYMRLDYRESSAFGLHPVYQLTHSDITGYIFHKNGAWYMGANSTYWEAVVVIAVLDGASYPQEVEHVWQEMGPYSGTWRADLDIRVSCSRVDKVSEEAGANNVPLDPTNERGRRKIPFEPGAIRTMHQALEAKGGRVPASPFTDDNKVADGQAVLGSLKNSQSSTSSGACAGVWIRGSSVHADLMGVYRRTEREEDGRPVFRRRRLGDTGWLELSYYDQNPRGFWGIARGEDEYLPLHKLDSTGTLTGLTASFGTNSPDGQKSSAWLEYAVSKKLLLPNSQIVTACVSWAEIAAAEAAERNPVNQEGDVYSTPNLPDEDEDSILGRACSSEKSGGLLAAACGAEADYGSSENDIGSSFKDTSPAHVPDSPGNCDLCALFGERYGGYATFDEFLEAHAPSLFGSASVQDLVEFSEVMGDVSTPVVKLIMLGFDTALWRRELNISRDELEAGYSFTPSQLEEVGHIAWDLGVRQAHAVELLDVALEPLRVLQESWAPVLALMALQQLDYYDLTPDLLLLDLNDVDLRNCVIRMLRAVGRDSIAPIRSFTIDRSKVDWSLIELVEEIGWNAGAETFHLASTALVDILMSVPLYHVPRVLVNLLTLHGVDSDSVRAVIKICKASQHPTEEGELEATNIGTECRLPKRPLPSSAISAVRQAFSHDHVMTVAISSLQRRGCLGPEDEDFTEALPLIIAGGVVIILLGYTWMLGRKRSSRRRKTAKTFWNTFSAARFIHGVKFWVQDLIKARLARRNDEVTVKKVRSQRTRRSTDKRRNRTTKPGMNSDADSKKNQRKKEELERRRRKEEKRKIEKLRRKEEARKREGVRRRREELREAALARERATKKLEEEARLRKTLEEERQREERWKTLREKRERKEQKKRLDAEAKKMQGRKSSQPKMQPGSSKVRGKIVLECSTTPGSAPKINEKTAKNSRQKTKAELALPSSRDTSRRKAKSPLGKSDRRQKKVKESVLKTKSPPRVQYEEEPQYSSQQFAEGTWGTNQPVEDSNSFENPSHISNGDSKSVGQCERSRTTSKPLLVEPQLHFDIPHVKDSRFRPTAMSMSPFNPGRSSSMKTQNQPSSTSKTANHLERCMSANDIFSSTVTSQVSVASSIVKSMHSKSFQAETKWPSQKSWPSDKNWPSDDRSWPSEKNCPSNAALEQADKAKVKLLKKSGADPSSLTSWEMKEESKKDEELWMEGWKRRAEKRRLLLKRAPPRKDDNITENPPPAGAEPILELIAMRLPENLPRLGVDLESVFTAGMDSE